MYKIDRRGGGSKNRSLGIYHTIKPKLEFYFNVQILSNFFRFFKLKLRIKTVEIKYKLLDCLIFTSVDFILIFISLLILIHVKGLMNRGKRFQGLLKLNKRDCIRTVELDEIDCIWMS